MGWLSDWAIEGLKKKSVVDTDPLSGVTRTRSHPLTRSRPGARSQADGTQELVLGLWGAGRPAGPPSLSNGSGQYIPCYALPSVAGATEGPGGEGM